MYPEYASLAPLVVAAFVAALLWFIFRKRSARGVYWSVMAFCCLLSLVEPRASGLWQFAAACVGLYVILRLIAALHELIQHIGTRNDPPSSGPEH